tara:strand:- start:145 stop:381 length:237 start_codon:yes stop_codon:yes gene_type:complete
VYNIPIRFKNKELKMSNNINTQVLEQIAEEVNELSSMSVVNELGMVPIADSFDEFLALTDMQFLREKLVMQRFEEVSI